MKALLVQLLGWRCERLPVPCLSCNSTAQIPSMAPHGPDLRASCRVSRHGVSSIRPPPSFPGLSPWHIPCASAKLNYSLFPPAYAVLSAFHKQNGAVGSECALHTGCMGAGPAQLPAAAGPQHSALACLTFLICKMGITVILHSWSGCGFW